MKYLDSINLTLKFGRTIDEMIKLNLGRISLIYFEDNEKYKISFYLKKSNFNLEIKLLLKYYLKILLFQIYKLILEIMI